jgi:hypothetical protein
MKMRMQILKGRIPALEGQATLAPTYIFRRPLSA